MYATSILPTRQIQVNNDYDVISLRQIVREMARTAGLGLAQQARITAAISEVARVLLLDRSDMLFTVQVAEAGQRRALEVHCVSPVTCASGMPEAVGPCPFREARSLVDETTLDMANEEALLTLRMWLER